VAGVERLFVGKVCGSASKANKSVESTLFVAIKKIAAMKQPDFLKKIHIGKIILAEMEKRCLTQKILAERMNLKKWIVRDTFKQPNIKINRLIKFSYAIEINFLLVYLKEMPMFANTKHFEDEVTLDVIDGQAVITLSKKSRTTDFLQSIHIGHILKAEAKKQGIQDLLPNFCYCSQSVINRIFGNSDIYMDDLIQMSYVLKYDFLRNVYLPYMAVNKDEMIANDCVDSPCSFKIKPEMLSILSEKQIGIYDGNWSPR
jgi:hypothetical protein